MSSEVQGRLKALQEHLAAVMAEEAARAEEAGRGTHSQDEREVAMRARETELTRSLGGGGGRPTMDGAF